MTRKTFILAGLSTLFAALIVIVVLSLSQRGNMATETAKKATTSAQNLRRGAVAAGKLAAAAKKKTDKVSRKVDRQVIKLDRTITVLGKAGVQGLPGKNGTAGPPGITGAQGPPGKVPFTLADVLAGLSPKLTEALTDRLPGALELACGGSCDGRPGADGKDGKDAPAVTQDMVDLAMAHYCDVHNGCQGPPGAASTVPGPQGVPGDPGPQGPPGADSQVVGPQGPPGVDGVTTTVLVPCVGPGDPIAACP